MVVRRRAVLGPAVVAIATAVVHALGQIGTPIKGVVLVPTVGIALVAGLRWGGSGAIAAGVGLVAGGIATGRASQVHLGFTAASVTFAFMSQRIWGAVDAFVVDRSSEWALTTEHPQRIIVVALAAIPSAAVAGSVVTLLAGVPFYLVAPDIWIRVTINGVLIGIPLGLAVSAVENRVDRLDLAVPRRDGHVDGSMRFVLLSLGWIVVGSGIDLGFTLARIVPIRYYSSRFGLNVSVALFNTLQQTSHLALIGVFLGVAWRFNGVPLRTTGADDEPTAQAVSEGEPPDGEEPEPTPTDLSGTDERFQLTRRHAIAALTAMGVAELGADYVESPAEEGPFTDAERERLLAVAEVIYPSAVSVDQEFLERYVTGRYRDRFDDRQGAREALAFIDDVAKNRYGREFRSLSVADREDVLHSIGVDRVGPVRDGRLPERVRYYVVNDLLFALFSTPVGGELLGWENPTGFPGGLEAYQGGKDA